MGEPDPCGEPLPRKSRYNQEVSYQAANNACSTLSNNTIEYKRHSYRQIPLYLACVQPAKTGAYLRFDFLGTIKMYPLTGEPLAQSRRISYVQ